MTKRTSSFIKILATFAISPGFSGVLFILYGLLNQKESTNTLNDIIELIIGCVVFGFIGGLALYITPAFIIGLIYASLRLKKSWKSYVFVILFSPFFLFISNYLLMQKTAIPGWNRVEEIWFMLAMCALSSFSSIIAAYISFPKNDSID